MNKFKWTPRSIATALFIIIIVIAGYTYAIYRCGVNSGDEQAAVRYSKSEEAMMKKVSDAESKAAAAEGRANAHIENELVAATENALDRQKTEIRAEARSETDARQRAETASKLSENEAEKKRKIEQIKVDPNISNQVCAICEEYRKAGKPLSETLCGKCKLPT
jgi:hypothetical protein